MNDPIIVVGAAFVMVLVEIALPAWPRPMKMDRACPDVQRLSRLLLGSAEKFESVLAAKRV